MREAIGPPDSGEDEPCRWTARIGDASGGSMMPTRTGLARHGERLAAAHLVEAHGLEVLARNHRVALEDVRGELDVIAFDRRTGLLVVCEVKARSSRHPDAALGALSVRQQGRIRRMTAVLLATGALHASRVRFDLVAVERSGAGARAGLVHLAGAW